MTICAIVLAGSGCVRKAALASLAALCRPVVTWGRDARRELAGLPVDVVERESIPDALQVALAAAPHADAALLLRADQPSVTAADLSRLFARFRASRAAIVASAYEKTVGLPALFGRSLFGPLLGLAPETDVRSVIAANWREVTVVSIPRAAPQIESAEELAMLRERAPRRSPGNR